MSNRIDFTPFRHQPIDVHCHQTGEAEHLQILSLDTHELADGLSFPVGRYFSLGIHPWFIETQNLDSALQKLESYRNHPRLLAIGECGLDKTVATDLIRQVALFEKQIVLAERWNKPVMIHCVRAFNELMKIKKDCSTTVPWIIHGFNNKPQVAEQLIRHGCYLSLGKALLHGESNAAKTLLEMPSDRLFLETDAAADISIGEIYSSAAKIAGLTVAALRRQIFTNFNRVFSHE